MGIDAKIRNGLGIKRFLSVDRNHAASVNINGLPSENVTSELKPYVSLMTSPAGATDMLVDGSVTPQSFYIESSSEYDRHILTVLFTIADGGATFNKFGNISALTNGCELFYEDKELGDVALSNSLKSNFDFVQMCNFQPTFGTGTAAFRASNVEGPSEAFIPSLNIAKEFGLIYGVKLPAGSNKRIVFRINDDVSGIDRFDIKVLGYDVVNK